jgi:hypothetical protein
MMKSRVKFGRAASYDNFIVNFIERTFANDKHDETCDHCGAKLLLLGWGYNDIDPPSWACWMKPGTRDWYGFDTACRIAGVTHP